ncbi:MAG: hypothetical protein AAFO57_06080 [Pseudomonadota bacterium]
MANDPKDIAGALIDQDGELFSERMGANISRDTPQELFHWLCGTVLLSARISHKLAEDAGRALRDTDFYKIDKILSEDKWDLVEVLRHNGYCRYDTVTSDYLISAATLVREDYDDDLRKMREAAGGADAILERLQDIKGIGPVGAEISAREAQLVWDELFPRLGDPAREAASDLGLPTETDDLVDLAGNRERFVRLTAVLTRTSLDGVDEDVQDALD